MKAKVIHHYAKKVLHLKDRPAVLEATLHDLLSREVRRSFTTKQAPKQYRQAKRAVYALVYAETTKEEAFSPKVLARMLEAGKQFLKNTFQGRK